MHPAQYRYRFRLLRPISGDGQLDGYLARRLGANSVLGSYLDPLADKVGLYTIASCTLVLCPEAVIKGMGWFGGQVLIGCVVLAMLYADLLPGRETLPTSPFWTGRVLTRPLPLLPPQGG